MNIAVDDYVFASKWSDEDPNDPWCVGFVTEVMEDSIGKYVRIQGVTNRYWKHFRKITKEEGDKILATYPGLEGKNSENSLGYMRWQDKTYEIIDEPLTVGDVFYFPFCDRIEEYKDVDYGDFEPNKLGCQKVKLIN